MMMIECFILFFSFTDGWMVSVGDDILFHGQKITVLASFKENCGMRTLLPEERAGWMCRRSGLLLLL
jgi:hypothetical protein